MGSTLESFLHRRFWKGFLREWINVLEDDHYELIRRRFEFRGNPLHAVGFWNLLSYVLSHMAVVKLRDWGSFYHLLPENPNAAEWIIFWLRAIKSTDSLRGIRGGMDWIVHMLTQKIGFLKEGTKIDSDESGNVRYASSANGCTLRLNKRLIKVEDRGTDVLLTFEDNSRLRAEQVILALPKVPLEELEYVGQEEVDKKKLAALRVHLDSVFAFPLLKCFFFVDYPFWEDNRPPNRYAHNVPTRELHYWKNRDNTKGMMMLYTDRPGTQYWADYLTKEATRMRQQFAATKWGWMKDEALTREYGREIEKFENELLLRTFLLYTRENNVESITEHRLLAAGMRDWGLKPYGGAAHAWRSGSRSWETMGYLRAFSLTKNGTTRLHVCGEAYSDYQGFIEGALRSAKEVLVGPPFLIDESSLREPGGTKLPRTRRIGHFD